MATGSENVVRVLGLLLVQLAKQSLPQDFREADDGVERRAQFVRHVGEKFRLVPVRGLDLTALSPRSHGTAARFESPTPIA